MTVLRVLDLLGVFVFALSGALRAVEKRLDVFGMVVLAAVTALGGGVLRDVLLEYRPEALRDGGYLLAVLAASLLVAVASRGVVRLAAAVRLFDAAGLGLFVAAGTTTAYSSPGRITARPGRSVRRRPHAGQRSHRSRRPSRLCSVRQGSSRGRSFHPRRP